jgi:hypothetical protein
MEQSHTEVSNPVVWTQAREWTPTKSERRKYRQPEKNMK